MVAANSRGFHLIYNIVLQFCSPHMICDRSFPEFLCPDPWVLSRSYSISQIGGLAITWLLWSFSRCIVLSTPTGSRNWYNSGVVDRTQNSNCCSTLSSRSIKKRPQQRFWNPHALIPQRLSKYQNIVRFYMTILNLNRMQWSILFDVTYVSSHLAFFRYSVKFTFLFLSHLVFLCRVFRFFPFLLDHFPNPLDEIFREAEFL